MRLMVSGDEFVFEKEVDEQTAVSIVSSLLGKASVYDERVVTDKPAKTQTGLREFVDECGARRIPDKIVAIGLFLKKVEGKQWFSRDSLVESFEKIAEAVPRNLSRDVAWVTKIGWITEKVGMDGCYYVTQEGELAVEKKFSRELVAKTSIGSVMKTVK